MPKKNTKVANRHPLATNSAIEFVAFSALQESKETAQSIDNKILAIQTSRLSPFNSSYDASSPYQGFNLGLHVGDVPEQVVKNRQSLQELLPSDCKIQWLDQVHGNDVVTITEVNSQPLTADAAITQERNICLAVMTADCLPILLSSKQGDEVAVIHGGWRSLAANIIDETINTMDTTPSELCAWLGPCIGETAFEVGQEVREAFTNQNVLFSKAFSKQTSDKYLANLHCIAQIQLASLGVESISALSACTFSSPDKYYSYRKNNKTGRMASLICIR
ncbi:MAG: peptidoglycan editing factor PgeF [Colwellia sp.]|nr:peptidoglycan editing factor PgeF [Colwellia sp.]MCW8863953.1 peptidoglycan editing factor PgeF [Colwellia sp.]MCW9080108.1 peptidoglycan editing factor PgeF [Colwellia sp.]